MEWNGYWNFVLIIHLADTKVGASTKEVKEKKTDTSRD